MESIQIADRCFEKFIDYEIIKNRVIEISEQLSKQYQDKDPVFVPVLNGSFMFASDLLKNLNIKSSVHFIKVSSYEGTQSQGMVKSLFGLEDGIENKHIIIIEDIIDTGLTMKYILEEIKKLNPQSICIITLLYKEESLKYPIKPDIAGFNISHQFVVGYGLDYNGYGRNLRHIYKEKIS